MSHDLTYLHKIKYVNVASFLFYNRLSVAEKLPVEDNSVTLIQVATALHWFDLEKFYRECDRVLVPGGVIAAFSYAFKDFPIVNHPRGDDIHKVLTKITDKLVSPDINPYYTEHCDWVLHKYTSPKVQIPYKDTKRVDGQYMEFPSTISGILRCLMTTAFIRLFVNSSEENKLWWKDCHQRLMEAYGTDDPEAPLTYKLEVFMLLGRKPTS
ncbi:hypothetical protein EB796_002121 [Bugula neritina]|uniref:Methyltransferase type 11 domain-containing protein n=1 Tax=Bugula neritina TaxID=10212 RepID=A0A7J7KN36_BUGNE|nr:hypothetical protein EB796_002121 [Bugula neritina]